MRIITFLTVFIFSILSVHSQNVLELTNTKTGKTRIIKSGSKLLFKTIHDSSYVKGKIMQIKDSVMVIYLLDYEDGTPVADIPIKDLKEIKKATSLHAISRSVASVMLPVGAYFLGSGITALARNDSYKGQSTYDKNQARAYTYTGAGLVIAGAIPFIIKTKVYNFNKDWKVRVKKMS